MLRICVAFVLFSAALPPFSLSAAETLTYVGATTLQRFFMPQAAHAFFVDSGVSIRIHGGNTDPGLKEVLSGRADIAGSGRFLKEDEKSQGLVEYLIGWDPVAVVVHRTNPLEDLTLEQIRGIFSGRVRNWSEVGGADGPIMVITGPPGSGMRALVQEQILHEDDLAPDAVVVPLVADADRLVATFDQAVCALSSSMVNSPGVKILRLEGAAIGDDPLGDYPLLKPLLLVTKGPPAGEAKNFVEFALSRKGQQIMSRHFLPIR